jgi:hypothetical protein
MNKRRIIISLFIILLLSIVDAWGLSFNPFSENEKVMTDTACLSATPKGDTVCESSRQVHKPQQSDNDNITKGDELSIVYKASLRQDWSIFKKIKDGMANPETMKRWGTEYVLLAIGVIGYFIIRRRYKA